MEVAASSLISRHHHLALTDTLQISSFVAPTNTVASPPIKSRHATSRRSILKRRRRTRRRSPPSSSDDGTPFLGGVDDGAPFLVSADDGGVFGGGNWNFGGGGGGGNWSGDDWFSSFDNDNNKNQEDPAFDFVFEVVCWIVFSNCLHFAFKKVLRMVSEEREKVPITIVSVC